MENFWKNEMNRIIMSFTGGLDSTYLLYKTLKDTDDEVYAFTLDLKFCEETTFDHKQYMEKVCAMKIAQWMNNNIRPFKFDIIDVPKGFLYEKLPMMQALYFAIPYLNENLYDRFLFAYSAEDTGLFGQQVKNAMKYRFEQYAKRGTLEFPLQENNIGRAHQHISIPKEIMPYLADCTRIGPNHEKCGKCQKCKSRKQDYERLEQGLTPEECLALRIEMKTTTQNFVDWQGLLRTWVDSELNITGPVLPTSAIEHQEYKHIFTNNYDGGIHEPNE
jgi:7-cyano-7-deazaguanine synthase in queuosine biosynthesis